MFNQPLQYSDYFYLTTILLLSIALTYYVYLLDKKKITIKNNQIKGLAFETNVENVLSKIGIKLLDTQYLITEDAFNNIRLDGSVERFFGELNFCLNPTLKIILEQPLYLINSIFIRFFIYFYKFIFVCIEKTCVEIKCVEQISNLRSNMLLTLKKNYIQILQWDNIKQIFSNPIFLIDLFIVLLIYQTNIKSLVSLMFLHYTVRSIFNSYMRIPLLLFNFYIFYTKLFYIFIEYVIFYNYELKHYLGFKNFNIYKKITHLVYPLGFNQRLYLFFMCIILMKVLLILLINIINKRFSNNKKNNQTFNQYMKTCLDMLLYQKYLIFDNRITFINNLSSKDNSEFRESAEFQKYKEAAKLRLTELYCVGIKEYNLLNKI